MKHFTPELLAEYRSKDDRISDIASEKWEQEGEAYADYLRSVQSQLPVPLCEVLDNYYLHDARVIFAGWQGRDYCMTIRLDNPPHDCLMLRYELVADPVILRHEPAPASDVPIDWLYDEIEVRTDPAQPAFKHSILLTGGLELRIEFRNFSFMQVPRGQVVVGGPCAIALSETA